jgi:hypothetical protein
LLASRRPFCLLAASSRDDDEIAALRVLSLVTSGLAQQASEVAPEACGSRVQVVARARQYVALHLREAIGMGAVPQALGISQTCLNVSFEQVRGMTPAEA